MTDWSPVIEERGFVQTDAQPIEKFMIRFIEDSIANQSHLSQSPDGGTEKS
jgi:hypothetical protein